MLRSLLPPARRVLRHAPTRSVRRGVAGWAALGLVATATLNAPVIGPAAAAAADTGTHPTFAASYLSGVSGPRPERTVSLGGNLGLHAGHQHRLHRRRPLRHDAPARMTCVDSPPAARPTTIQVPGGGWLKQGWTDLSVARYQPTDHGCRTSRTTR